MIKMGGRGNSSGRGGGGGGNIKLPKLIGSEKQVKWATDIRDNYAKKLGEAERRLKKIVSSGSIKGESESERKATEFIGMYHPKASYNQVRNEMKSGNLFKAYMATKSGTPERKTAGKKFRSAVAKESLKRLKKESTEKLKEKNASKWIDQRPR